MKALLLIVALLLVSVLLSGCGRFSWSEYEADRHTGRRIVHDRAWIKGRKAIRVGATDQEIYDFNNKKFYFSDRR